MMESRLSLKLKKYMKPLEHDDTVSLGVYFYKEITKIVYTNLIAQY